jgi:hypothetical protein
MHVHMLQVWLTGRPKCPCWTSQLRLPTSAGKAEKALWGLVGLSLLLFMLLLLLSCCPQPSGKMPHLLWIDMRE